MTHRTNTSSIYSATYAQMEKEFGNSRIVSVVGLSTFVLGIAFGPMLLGPMSEFYGRRPIYLVSWLMFVIWIIPEAVGTNIATIIVARFFDGFAGSAFLAVAGGTVGDLFQKHELQAPMALFAVAPFMGPTMGPLVGGFINYNIDWRWTYYVLLIWSFVMWIAIIILVPETYRKFAKSNLALFKFANAASRPDSPAQQGAKPAQRDWRRPLPSSHRKSPEVRHPSAWTISVAPISAASPRTYVRQSLRPFRCPPRHPIPLLWRLSACLYDQLRFQPVADWSVIYRHRCRNAYWSRNRSYLAPRSP